MSISGLVGASRLVSEYHNLFGTLSEYIYGYSDSQAQ